MRRLHARGGLRFEYKLCELGIVCFIRTIITHSYTCVLILVVRTVILITVGTGNACSTRNCFYWWMSLHGYSSRFSGFAQYSSRVAGFMGWNERKTYRCSLFVCHLRSKEVNAFSGNNSNNVMMDSSTFPHFLP